MERTIVVFSVVRAAKHQNPLVYHHGHSRDDIICLVEEFFEETGIVVTPEEVEELAAELEKNGFAYYKNFAINIIGS